MDTLPIEILEKIVFYTGYQVNIALVNTRFFKLIHTHISCYKYYYLFEDACIKGDLNFFRCVLKHIGRNTKWTKNSYIVGKLAEHGHLHIIKYLKKRGLRKRSFQRAIKGAVKGNHLDCLKYLHEIGCEWDKKACSSAAENGHLDCLKYLRENGCEWDKKACSSAAENGHLECLKYLRENGCEWDKYTCSNAARNGHLECLKYLHENGCEWDKYACSSAARNGHLDCLKYLHENGCEWNKYACSSAAENGHLDCLKYLHENGCEWDKETCSSAARNGFECLKYLFENGCPIPNDIYYHYYSNCFRDKEDESRINVEHFKFIHKYVPYNTFHDEYSYYYDLTSGRLPCLDNVEIFKYINECTNKEKDGFNWNSNVYYKVAKRAIYTKNFECLDYLEPYLSDDSKLYELCRDIIRCQSYTSIDFEVFKNIHNRIKNLKISIDLDYEDYYSFCKEAAEKGTLEILKWVVLKGYHYNSKIYSAIFKNKDNNILKMVKFIHEDMKCFFPQNLCKIAVYYKCHLDCLRYLHENGCEWDKEACIEAAKHGHLDCLKYLHENGCEWDEYIYDYVHDLKCLKYIREQGVCWTDKVCLQAASLGNLSMLQYAVENGCEVSKEIFYITINNNKINMLKYLHKKYNLNDFLDEKICTYAVENKSFECLKFLHQNGFNLEYETIDLAYKMKQRACFYYIKYKKGKDFYSQYHCPSSSRSSTPPCYQDEDWR